MHEKIPSTRFSLVSFCFYSVDEHQWLFKTRYLSSRGLKLTFQFVFVISKKDLTAKKGDATDLFGALAKPELRTTEREFFRFP